LGDERRKGQGLARRVQSLMRIWGGDRRGKRVILHNGCNRDKDGREGKERREGGKQARVGCMGLI